MRSANNIPAQFLKPVLVQVVTVVLLPVIGLIAIDLLVIHPLVGSNQLSANLAIGLIIAPKLVVLPWIGFSTLRFTEDHYEKFGISTVKTSLFVCLFLTVLVISVSAIDAIQTVIFSQNAKANSGQDDAPLYRFSADVVKQAYAIEGIIDFGISSDFRLFLEQNPGGTRVILDSQGGSIYEARGLAVLIQKLELDTHVNNECSSACTLAFIGGQLRSIGVSAKLGFHQYSMDYENRHQVLPFHDPLKEQEHDAMQMLERGISKEFVDKIFDKLHQDIWYPDHASLLRFGVIHEIR